MEENKIAIADDEFVYDYTLIYDNRLEDLNMEENKISDIEPGYDYKLFYDVEKFRKYVRKHKIKIAYYDQEHVYNSETNEMETQHVIQMSSFMENKNERPLYFCFIKKSDDGKMYIEYCGSMEQSNNKNKLIPMGFKFTRDVICEMISEKVITNVAKTF